jgi:hypothetical protein
VTLGKVKEWEALGQMLFTPTMAMLKIPHINTLGATEMTATGT